MHDPVTNQTIHAAPAAHCHPCSVHGITTPATCLAPALIWAESEDRLIDSGDTVDACEVCADMARRAVLA